MREQIAANAAILKRLAEIDRTLLEHDDALRVIWEKLQPLRSTQSHFFAAASKRSRFSSRYLPRMPRTVA